MRTRKRVAARFYKSSDRTHITPIRWLKKEREEWEQDSRDTALRVREHMGRGDTKSALAALLHLERLEAYGISTAAHIVVRREFMSAVALVDKR